MMFKEEAGAQVTNAERMHASLFKNEFSGIRPLRDFGWYVRRLRVMSPMEILFRVVEQWSMKMMQLKYMMRQTQESGSCYDVNRLVFCAGSAPQLPELPWSFEPDSKMIANLLAGKSKALGFEWTWRPEIMVWHEAPDTGNPWPQTFFGSIRYRAGNPYGDIRVVWEPSRLQNLVTLGLLTWNVNEEIREQAAVLIEKQLLSWAEANPIQKGIHYVSSMECALRILAVCYAVDLARKRLIASKQVWKALVDLITEHANFISNRLSLHSSTGNHTIAESAGLVYAGVLFPELDGAANWKNLGLSILDRESERQILRDGGGAEQAFWYLQFIVDLYGLVVALLEHRHEPVSPTVHSAYTRGRQFLNELENDGGGLPHIGDADNGYALSPFLFLSRSRCCEERPLVIFEDSGYSMIRDRKDKDTTLIFDHGPLGMAPSYGHGHADALSIVLRRGQEEILIDPGTYTYAGDSHWRSYFRGTSAHNTVTVDGLDQAVQETPFMWSQPFRTELFHHGEALDGEIRLLAYHTGYSRLKPGVEHWRSVIYRPPGLWLIFDYLTGNGVHTLDLHWHCGIRPIQIGRGFVFSAQDQGFSIIILGGEISLHTGEENPISGWRSRMYGIKEAITTIRAQYTGRLPYEFVTQIKIGHELLKPWDTELSFIRGWINEVQTSRTARCAGRLR